MTQSTGKITFTIPYSSVITRFYDHSHLTAIGVKHLETDLGVTGNTSVIQCAGTTPFDEKYVIHDRDNHPLYVQTTNQAMFSHSCAHANRTFESQCERPGCLNITSQPQGIPVFRTSQNLYTEKGELRHIKIYHDLGRFCSYECALTVIRLLQCFDLSSTLIDKWETLLREMFQCEYPDQKLSCPFDLTKDFVCEKIFCKDFKTISSKSFLPFMKEQIQTLLPSKEVHQSRGVFCYLSGLVVSIPCKTSYIEASIVSGVTGQKELSLEEQIENLAKTWVSCRPMYGTEILHPNLHMIIETYRQNYLKMLASM